MTKLESNSQSTLSRLARPEMLIALSAIIISLCALVVSLYETSLIRQEQRASVWPHLMVGPSFQSKRFIFIVHNTGIGPARIRDVEVTVNGERVLNWVSMLEAITGVSDSFNLTYSQINKRVIPPDDPFEMFSVSVGEDGIDEELALLLTRETEHYNISICYCSVYDECWTVNTSSNIPEETHVNDCSPEQGRSFEM